LFSQGGLRFEFDRRRIVTRHLHCKCDLGPLRLSTTRPRSGPSSAH
jgi:hypothetical protein